MNRRSAPALLAALLLPAFAGASHMPSVRAASAIVVDPATGQALDEKNADQRRPIASTQKLLTALIVAEAGNLDRPVTVAASDTRVDPVKLYLKAGDVYTRRQLLEALLVKSGNDVAVCLARDHAGSVAAFAEKMNRRAWELGARNSRFVNPNGLPASAQYATARDLSRIALAAYRNRTIREIVNKKEVVFRFADGTTRTLTNTNRVLRYWEPCNGMKTGYTDASGHCLVASGAWNNRQAIAVVLGSTRSSVWTDAAQLLSWGLSR